MKYKITTIEMELWDREYIVEAESKEEADTKLLKGDFEECLDGNCVNSTMNTLEIYEVEEDEQR